MLDSADKLDSKYLTEQATFLEVAELLEELKRGLKK